MLTDVQKILAEAKIAFPFDASVGAMVSKAGCRTATINKEVKTFCLDEIAKEFQQHGDILNTGEGTQIVKNFMKIIENNCGWNLGDATQLLADIRKLFCVARRRGSRCIDLAGAVGQLTEGHKNCESVAPTVTVFRAWLEASHEMHRLPEGVESPCSERSARQHWNKC